MLGNLLKLGNIQIRDIMVPRADIVSINIDSDFETTLKLFIEAAHSRLPVYKDQLDNIVGMLHVKDLLPYWHINTKFSIKKVKRNVLFSSPAMLVNDLLEQMRATRTHLAIIVDEHGGTDGLVTIEDLVEEIVGEIKDEHDSEEVEEIKKISKKTFELPARVSLEEFEKEIGVKLKIEKKDEIDTIGGFIFFLIGRIPGRGEVINYNKVLEFTIIEADTRRIKKILVTLKK